jgi:hypothetical protein
MAWKHEYLGRHSHSSPLSDFDTALCDPHALLCFKCSAKSVHPLAGVKYSNKVSHGYTASVGSSRQIPLKKELCIQVKPFFLKVCRCITSRKT